MVTTVLKGHRESKKSPSILKIVISKIVIDLDKKPLDQKSECDFEKGAKN